MNIIFRQITTGDFEFLWQLHNKSLKQYITQTWGWNEDWQRRDFTEKFNPADGEIIVIDGVDAGFWRVNNHETEILLSSIRILPEFQNKGVGSKIIKNLLDESEKPIRLQVLKVNPARLFIRKIGFRDF
jgi:GNAT superfamily N-acetyltransferase